MPVVQPSEPYLSDERLLRALCIYREARGEAYEGKLGVNWVLSNRCAMAPREGFHHTATGNILKPWAFSSFMEGDPNSKVYPSTPDDPETAWQDCLRAVDSGDPDPTGGSVFYFSLPIKEPPRGWGQVEFGATVGRLSFYRKMEA